MHGTKCKGVAYKTKLQICCSFMRISLFASVYAVCAFNRVQSALHATRLPVESQTFWQRLKMRTDCTNHIAYFWRKL